MSDNKKQSFQDGNATSTRPHPSVWMAHWTPTACKSANRVSNNLSLCHETVEGSYRTRKRPLLTGPMPVTEVLNHDNGSEEVAGVGADNPNNGRSKKRRKEMFDSEPFPMLNASQHREGKPALNIEQAKVSPGGAVKFQTGSSSGHKILYLDEKKSQCPLLAFVPERGKVKKEYIMSKGIERFPPPHEDSDKFLDNNTLTVSTFVRDEIIPMGSASKFIPYEMHSSGIPITAYEQNINNQSNSYLSSKRQVGNTNFHSYSTLFVQETKINQIVDSTHSSNSLARQNMRTFLLHNPSSSNLVQPNPFPKCDAQKSGYNTLPFQSLSNHPGPTLPEHLHHGGYPLQRLPYSVHDLEAMRIRTAVDSVEEALRGPSEFSQATHHLMITKKTDVSLYEGQEFREAAATSNHKGKVTSALLSLSTNFGIHDQMENELMQPSGSVDGETENFGNIKTSAACLSNESSSETDIMDMDAFQENLLTGADSSQADKDLGILKSPLPSASMTRNEFGDWLLKERLPDINERPPDLSASTSLMDNRESSTSKTESLNVDHLLPNTEQPRFSNSTVRLDDSSKMEISSRWVKRLKPCASESVHDIKSSKNEEASSSGKADPLFNKMECSSIRSKRSMGQLLEKEQLSVGQTASTVKDSDLYSSLSRKNREIMFSNPWIRRWCHNRPLSSERNLETAVVHKPECPSPTLDKPFPSIAAMALMGKAVAGFQPCEFSKRGSSLVWNT